MLLESASTALIYFNLENALTYWLNTVRAYPRAVDFY
jgi:hypothetical protein